MSSKSESDDSCGYVTVKRVHFGPSVPKHETPSYARGSSKMSSLRWAECCQARKLVTTTQQINLCGQTKNYNGMVSYEDLLIAQYLDELRNTNKKKHADESKPSPYIQKLPHSDYTYKFRQRRPVSATMTTSCSGKPKIDAKFIADPSLWDPATPRPVGDDGTEKFTPIVTEKTLRMRPCSAPVKKTRHQRPISAASTLSFYGRRPWSGRPAFGRKIKSQYKKQPHTIKVTAFKNGSREPFVRLAAPNIKMLLEYCTEKLGLPFAARRVFLKDGVEVFVERDIPVNAEVYISQGENYKDPYATTKRNIILSNGAKWTLTGVMLSEEGKKKVSKPKLSKRMRKLADKKGVRIIVYRNGKCTEPVEIVAELVKTEEFLVACTAKLDLRSHARILYDWEGNEISSLAETPILDECLQPGGTYVLGPVWVSVGERFSPTGTRDFIITIREVIKTRLKEAKLFKKELIYKQEGDDEKVTIAVKILSMTPEEVEEAIGFTNSDIEQLKQTLTRLNEKLEALDDMVKEEETQGSHYRMQNITEMSEKRYRHIGGLPGLRLRVHENGTVDNPRDFMFNLREASKGAVNKEMVLQRLLDELSGSVLQSNPKTPKLAPIAKKIFNKFGREFTDVFSLEQNSEIWVSFGENYISPFTYCLQVIFDNAKGKDVFGEKQYVLREQLTPEQIEPGMERYENWEATIGYPPTYDWEPCKYESERGHVESMASMAELDQRGHFLQLIDKPKMVLYPELIMNHKLPLGHKELWPSETQIWVISKAGFIYCKAFPQLCLAVSETRMQTNLTGKDHKVDGWVVTLQKRMVGNPHQMWKFNDDATIASKAYPNMLLTYLGKKFGEETEDSVQPEGVKPGSRVYLIVSDPLTKKDAALQRFAIKQERLENLGQWKFTEASNTEWNKQALSWPVRADGTINEEYDWPMQGYILPYAPKLHIHEKKTELSGLAPLRLFVVKNGERNLSLAVPVVGPNLTNYVKDLTKRLQKPDKNKRRRAPAQEEMRDEDGESIELDIDLHCQDLTIRELDMFLDHCTGMLDLPFAARRLFDEKGNEHFSLKTLKRDQLVYVTCGEIWSDPRLSKMEQHRRTLLSQLAQDVTKMRQYAALRNPEKYVLEVDSTIAANSPIIVNQQWSREDEQQVNVEMEQQSVASAKSETDEDSHSQMSAHARACERGDQRLNNLKWPWERLVNVNNSFDADPEAEKYTDREMYEKYKPRTVTRPSRDTLQRFVFEDGYIACAANRNLVLGVSEPEGRIVEVHLVKRRPDDIYQQWLMRENGEIRPRHNQQVVLTVSMPTNEPYAEDTEGQPLTFADCRVTLQTRRTNQYGKAHQRWRYDAETGFIHAFYTDLHDKEITAANKADVCTYAIANTSKIDQPGYLAEVPIQGTGDKNAGIREIMVCTSCARAMRGRYKLSRLSPNTEFFCAMGNAKKLKLQQIGSFRVLNGKVDLSTHEYQLTLTEWETKLANLREETNIKSISKEINVAKTVQTVKVLAYKNGEGRLRPGEIICGSSVHGILNQCTARLMLNKAACRMYTEDGTIILETDDMIEWAVENYRSLMADHLERLYQGKQDTDTEKEEEEGQQEADQQERGEGEGQDSQGEGDKEAAETDEQEADKAKRQREYLLSQVRLPTKEIILRYPIEIWVSSGKPFVPPEVVESKIENRKKKRAFRAAVSLELDIEKHVLRQMKGRRLEELSPGEYRGTKNTLKPVVVEGHWEEPTPEEQQKHDTVHKLQEHLAEVKLNQQEKRPGLVSVNFNKILYKQPDTKRIMVYPNGESVERATYIWGETLDELLNSATQRLNLWQPARRFFTMDGKEIFSFEEIQRDEVLCASTGKPFKPTQTSKLDIEIKANWSRAHKQYGTTATDVTVQAETNPKINVDPFGPPGLALPVSNSNSSPVITQGRQRPTSAKPPSARTTSKMTITCVSNLKCYTY